MWEELIEYAAKQVVHRCRSGVTVKLRMSGRPHACGGRRAAGVEGGDRADDGERVVAGRRVGLLVGTGVGLAVELEHLQGPAAQLAGGVEVGGEGLGALTCGGEEARHRTRDVGGVGDGDRGVGDAGLVLEPVAAALRPAAGGRLGVLGGAGGRGVAGGGVAGRRVAGRGVTGGHVGVARCGAVREGPGAVGGRHRVQDAVAVGVDGHRAPGTAVGLVDLAGLEWEPQALTPRHARRATVSTTAARARSSQHC